MSRLRLLPLLATALLVAALPVRAQLRLPGGLGNPTNNLPSVIQAPPLTAPRLPELRSDGTPLQGLRQRLVRELLRDAAAQVEADSAGEPVVRGELIVLAPTPALLATAQAQGFRVLRAQRLEALDLHSVVLAPPAGIGTSEGLARLREIDPAVEVDYQHLYTRSGESSSASAPSTTAPGLSTARRVGLIDGGIDRTHPSLRTASLRIWGCDGATVPSEHGTAVASLLVGRDAAFVGVLGPEAHLHAADVYCGRATGGSVEALVQALAWLAQERVAVINISLVGPPNRWLERAVRAAIARGHLIVAAVGNDGPSAPPLYPAAYPEVVGVTGVAPSRRVLPEALRGPQVAFAAPGAELAVAQSGAAGYAVARGTSFAAPLVAGLLAEQLSTPDVQGAREALARLSRQAADLGARGRDEVYGWGLVAEQARNQPERVQAMWRTPP